jgi:DNA-binding XRE family transcriptional regulator
MNKLVFLPHDRLHAPLWTGRFLLGRFTLNLSVSRDTAQIEQRILQRRITNHVAALRREYDLSRQDLARLLSIHPSTLLALEHGCYIPSLDLALRLSAFFAQPVEAIFSVTADEDTILA